MHGMTCAGITDVSVVGTASQPVLSEMDLNVCDATCETKHVSVTVKLQTSHVGRGCDREEWSLRQHRHDCGRSEDSLNQMNAFNLCGFYLFC
jgi:hypothetical protein